MQRVLAEVTQHMEQQYSSHRYLEKLRAENETMALQEKDRKVFPWTVAISILVNLYDARRYTLVHGFCFCLF